jgi:4-alpha-glucanotransferase
MDETQSSRRFPRAAGVLCHVTCLPGRYGIGDLGQAAHQFVDWLASAGQGVWQMLPLGPPGYGESPYQSFSAFAGNPLLVGLDKLAEEGWLSKSELDDAPQFEDAAVDFEKVRPFRRQCLARAHQAFLGQATNAQKIAFEEFCGEQGWWLDDYVKFAALKEAHQDRPWTNWTHDASSRTRSTSENDASELTAAEEFERFVQFQFHSQWRDLQAHARTRGIRLMGDVPIFVAHDSADVWAHQDLFYLDELGQPTVVAGVPPDYFSETGQLWGNPLYRWDRMERDGYSWWRQRLGFALRQFDLVRLDHFRGFESYWEIPAGAPTAAHGRWVPGPGAKFFRQLAAELGELPIVAEDLGVITAAVDALRDGLGLPGMRILQFAFGEDAKGPEYRPHNYPRHCVVYTGTHDNDTTVGWFESGAGAGTTRTARQVAEERRFALAYIGTDGRQIHWDMIRLALGSVADTAIVPLQDVLGLGTGARMNLPGTARGNWRWRFTEEMLPPEATSRLAEMTAIYDRNPWENSRSAKESAQTKS